MTPPGSAIHRYVCSYDMVELAFCLGFAALGARLPYIWEPSSRMGVPHQIVGGEGDEGGSQLLFDLTFDRTSSKETVSTELLIILGIVLPLVLQCALLMLETILFDRKSLDNQESCDANNCDSEGVEIDCFGGIAENMGEDQCQINTGGGTDQKSLSSVSDDGRDKKKGRYFFIHTTLCTYATTIGMTLLFTESVKRYVGYMRPNFYQLCQPEYDSQMNEAATLVCSEEISGDTDIERYQSFPSGHASVAYGGLTLLSLFLGRFFGFSRHQNNVHHSAASVLRNHERLRRLLYFISVLLVQALALWIATTRLVDFVHHPADVLAGAVLGAGCAIFVDGMW